MKSSFFPGAAHCQPKSSRRLACWSWVRSEVCPACRWRCAGSAQEPTAASQGEDRAPERSSAAADQWPCQWFDQASECLRLDTILACGLPSLADGIADKYLKVDELDSVIRLTIDFHSFEGWCLRRPQLKLASDLWLARSSLGCRATATKIRGSSWPPPPGPTRSPGMAPSILAAHPDCPARLEPDRDAFAAGLQLN